MMKVTSPAVPAGDDSAHDESVRSRDQEMIIELRHKSLNLIQPFRNARRMMRTPQFEDLFAFLESTRSNPNAHGHMISRHNDPR